MERLHQLARRRRLPAQEGGFVYICGTCEEPFQGRKPMTRHLMETHEEEFTEFREEFKLPKQSDKDFETQISKLIINANFEPFDEETAKSTLKALNKDKVIDMDGDDDAKNAEIVPKEKVKDPIFADPKLSGNKRPPLSLDMMKLTDVRSCNMKNCGGITGRVARILGLVYNKTPINPRPVFSCKHCDVQIDDGDAEDMKKHLESKHEDFLANLPKLFPQGSKRMDQHIAKALLEFKFKASGKIIPLTLDMMKLQDTRTQALKNYGGIAGRIARQIGLVFKKEIVNDGAEFNCVHCDEDVVEGELKNHLEKSHQSFLANLLKIFPGVEEKEMGEHIAKGASGFELKVLTGEEEAEDDDDEEEGRPDEDEEKNDKEDAIEIESDKSDDEQIEEIDLESDDDEKEEDKSPTKRKSKTDQEESPKKAKLSEPADEKEKGKNGDAASETEENEQASEDEEEEDDIPGVDHAKMMEVDEETRKADDSMSGRLAAQLELIYTFEGDEGAMKAVCKGCSEEVEAREEVGSHIKTIHNKVYDNITDILSKKEGEVMPTTPASLNRYLTKAAGKLGIKA